MKRKVVGGLTAFIFGLYFLGGCIIPTTNQKKNLADKVTPVVTQKAPVQTTTKDFFTGSIPYTIELGAAPWMHRVSILKMHEKRRGDKTYENNNDLPRLTEDEEHDLYKEANINKGNGYRYISEKEAKDFYMKKVSEFENPPLKPTKKEDLVNPEGSPLPTLDPQSQRNL